MRSRIALLVVLIVLGIATVLPAGAFTPGQWTYSGVAYSTKAAAIAAMQAAAPQNSVLTEEVGPVGMSNSQVTYEYVAPPRSPSYTAYTYYPGAGAGGSWSDLSDAILALEDGSATSICGYGTATATTDWEMEDGPPDTEDVQYYSVTWPGWGWLYGCSFSTTANTEIVRQTTASCPTYYSFSSTPPYCADTTVAYIYGEPDECPTCNPPAASPLEGNPIDVASADKWQTETDYSGPALSFVRSYHSATLESAHGLGVGWTHNFAATLLINAFTGQPTGMVRPDGHHDPISSISGELVSQSGASIHVQASGSNWIATLSDGSQEVYGPSGSLIQLVSPAGQVTTLNYNTDGTLSSVVGPFGHSLQFAYTSGNLTQLTDPAGQTISYGYDVNNNLISVTYQDGSARVYEYEVPGFPNLLTGITDESSVRFATFGYDSNTWPISSQHAGGADAISVSYGSSTATVTDALSGTTVFDFTNQASFAQRVTSVAHNGLTQSFVVADPGTDIQQRVTQMTDANGNVTTYAYDTDHLTSRSDAYGTAIARTTSYDYLGTSAALPTLVTEALRQTAYTYYSGTNLVETKTITDTTVTPNVARTWTYTYDSYGRVLTVKGPRTDLSSTTTYTYYTCTTGAECGQIETVTDAVGNVTTYNTYNAHGQPLTVTDPNGIVTTMTYDARLRLTSREVGTETTAFVYYPTGLLETVTLPDSSTLQYTYDGAHRLDKIADGAGNSIQYTLDAMGNRTSTSAYDPSSVLSRTQSRVFNSLNQLYQQIGAAGTTAVTTTYGYDSNGNQTSIDAPLSRDTANVYDALNRLIQVTDPNSGNTYFGYDAEDDLTSVQDPRSLTTSYTYNGFGDVATLASPDTGTRTNTYDSGGNLSSSQDARSATATYSYDAQNRVTQIAYGDQTIAYTYDSGTNGKGRLTGASDSTHSMSWQYDANGRVTSKSQTVAGVTLSVGYTFTAGDLTTLTTPSGQTVTYSYTDHLINSISVNGSTLLSSVAYEPFGPSRGWSWGNGASEVRLHDTDGNPSEITGAESTSYSVDSAFRITGITNASNSALSWTYGYDNLDRLTSAAQTATTDGWTFDANGNRLTQTGTNASTYTVSGSSNQITGISGALSRSYTYDAAGNVVADGTNYLAFNNRGRLSSVTPSSYMYHYVYNVLGQRIEKYSYLSATLFVYDESGHLLGEYDGSGNLIQETVWLGDIPVATLRPNGSGGVNTYYIHVDYLNAPKSITRSSDNAIVWRWDQDPFGATTPNQNPSSLGTFAYNLRFPGQYFDAETGFNYNYMRDFDPTTGRYVESDPIGLKGGINTYAYADGNPISEIDPRGLSGNGTGWGPYQFHPHPPNSSGCDGNCKGNDVLAIHYDNSSCGYDIECQLAMQSAGFIPHTDYYSKSCLLKMGLMVKPAGYVGSEAARRGLPWALGALGASEGVVGSVTRGLSLVLGPEATVAFWLPLGLASVEHECSCNGN